MQDSELRSIISIRQFFMRISLSLDVAILLLLLLLPLVENMRHFYFVIFAEASESIREI